MRFIYLIPKTDKVLIGDISARLSELNMGHIGVSNVPSDAACNEVTVDGRVCYLLVPHQHGAPQGEFTYQPEQQTWLEPDEAGVQIGYWNDNLPSPSDLVRARRELVRWYGFEDDGGREWTTPVARSPNCENVLPVEYQFDALTNSPRPQCKATFNWLWDLSGEVWDYWNASHDKPSDPAWLVDVARQLIGVNYFVGARELNALCEMGCSLVDDVRAAAMSQALIEFDVVLANEDDAKKKPAE